jgi:hypothetical protein
MMFSLLIEDYTVTGAAVGRVGIRVLWIAWAQILFSILMVMIALPALLFAMMPIGLLRQNYLGSVIALQMYC